MQKEDIVILGGGFVGMMIVRKLLKAGVIGRSCEVTVIDQASSHTYTPWLYEVSSGYLSRHDGRKERCALEVSASVRFADIPGYSRVRFRKGVVTGIDTASKVVALHDGLTVRYSMLVIALGSTPNYFGIPGLQEHAIPLKSAAHAAAIERRMRELVLTASPESPKHVVVVGGGASGVELTAELMTAVHALEGRGEILSGAVTVTLVDRQGPLAQFGERLIAVAERRLKKIGVRLVKGTVMSAGEGVLSLKDALGDVMALPCDLCVWSGGVMPQGVVKTLGLPMDPKGRLLVEPAFAVQGVKGIFAAGDCAALMNPITGMTEPMSAQVAVNQGDWVARNILRALRGQPMKPFPFRKHWEVLIALGGKTGVGVIQGMVISGALPFYLRRFVDFRYFYWILPLRFAVTKWLKGVLLYNEND